MVHKASSASHQSCERSIPGRAESQHIPSAGHRHVMPVGTEPVRPWTGSARGMHMPLAETDPRSSILMLRTEADSASDPGHTGRGLQTPCLVPENLWSNPGAPRSIKWPLNLSTPARPPRHEHIFWVGGSVAGGQGRASGDPFCGTDDVHVANSAACRSIITGD